MFACEAYDDDYETASCMTPVKHKVQLRPMFHKQFLITGMQVRVVTNEGEVGRWSVVKDVTSEQLSRSS